MAVNTKRAGEMLGRTPKTISNWLGEDSTKPKHERRFPNAWKDAEWAIPIADIFAYRQRHQEAA